MRCVSAATPLVSFMTLPSTRRHSEDVADRNISEALQKVESEKGSVPSAILINSGSRRFSEDVADKNIDTPKATTTGASTLNPPSEKSSIEKKRKSDIPRFKRIYSSSRYGAFRCSQDAPNLLKIAKIVCYIWFDTRTNAT